MKYLAPIPKQFVDQNGLPLSNGAVHVYISGDTQYANVYQDADGNELMPNPARLDSNGAWLGFVTAGAPLDYVVEDKDGNVQFEYEKVVAGSGTANVAIEPVLTSGTKIAECWVDGELLELFAPEDSYTANLPIKITGDTITNNGTGITCTGKNAWAEGHNTTASGKHSHAEGDETIASGDNAHAEGTATKATHPHAHAEGFRAEATATGAHAEGSGAKAITTTAHAEGQDTVASGDASHAQGRNSVASGAYSHASGYGTRATGEGSHAVGKYNDDGSALFVVGNGSGLNNRKDVFKVDSNGDSWVMIGGVLTKVTNVTGSSDSQFVLVRSNMTTDFTNQEYQDCVDAAAAGKAVCVQFERNSRTFQAQLAQVETDTGLLVFEIDVANIHITYEVSGTNNSHAITESDYQNGTPIFDTLQTAITWNVVLHNGDIFETNGFHTSGDGGAARYKVSSTGTANGMDIVQLAAGKLAVLQVGDWIIPEQLGYEQSYSRNDVVPYIQRAIDIGCQHVHLRSSGNGAGYTWKTKLTVSVRGFKLTGEGDWGYPNKFTYVVFRPNESVTEMIDLTMRDALISDIDFEVTGDNVKLVDGITCSTYNMDETRFWEFRNLRFNSFRRCIYLGGTIKWQNVIKDCLFNSCVIGIEIYESSTMQLLIENCQFIGCDTHDLLFNGNVLSAKMICCNFGSVDNAVAFKVNSSTYLYQNASFESCNFENDNADGHNRRALAIDLYDSAHSGLRQNITISNCHFVIGKASAPEQDTTNRFIRLGDSTNLVFLNNQILGHNEPEHSTWVTNPKLLWDEISLPVNGGVVCVGKSVSLDFPNELLPYVQRNDEAGRLSVSCRRNASEQGWPDCDTWLPDYDGQVKVCGVSTYESPATQNLPIAGTFGFLWVIGTISGSAAGVLQRYEASNGNIYTRLGRGNNGVWTWESWKTIIAT